MSPDDKKKIALRADSISAEEATASSPAENLEFARGSILRQVLRMGLPSTIGFLAMNVYDLANMFWVSRLGAQYVAAIAVFEGFYWVITCSNDIAGLGSIAVISRRYGENDLPAAATAIKETFILKILLGVISGIIGWIFLRPLMLLMGAEGEVVELGVQFGRVHMLGLAIYFCSYTIFTSLRCIDAPNQAMVVMLIGAVLNVALDPLFIFGVGPFPRLGIAGAAVGAIVAYSITVVIGLYVFYTGKAPVNLRLARGVPIRFKSLWTMFKIGLPGGVNSASFALSRAVIMPLVAIFGTNVVAAYGMGLRISQIGILMVVGLSLGISPLIGNLAGAGLVNRMWRAARHSLWLATGIISGVGALIFAFAPQITRAFFQDEAVITLGVEMLRIYALALPPIGLWIIVESVFHGTGDNVPPMVLSLVTSWMVEIPLVILFTRWMGYDQTAIWWIHVCYATSGAFIGLYLLRRGSWAKKRV